MVQVKAALVTIIKNYEISLNEKTKEQLEFDVGNPFTLCPKGGIWMNVKKIHK